MSIVTNPDALALLQTILERPADDAARLIYADWLEEHGAPVHSEFIRLQVEFARRMGAAIDDPETLRHDAEAIRLLGRERDLLAEGPDGARSPAWDWMGQHVEAMVPYGAPWEIHVRFRRGLVAGVRCTLEQWCDVPIPCRQCVGRGVVADQPCSLCQGRMVNLGHGPAACLSQPLEWVVAADKAPFTHFSGEAFWFTMRWAASQANLWAILPAELFELVVLPGRAVSRPGSRRDGFLGFPSAAEAQAALSAALLLWARRQAGLPDRP